MPSHVCTPRGSLGLRRVWIGPERAAAGIACFHMRLNGCCDSHSRASSHLEHLPLLSVIIDEPPCPPATPDQTFALVPHNLQNGLHSRTPTTLDSAARRNQTSWAKSLQLLDEVESPIRATRQKWQ